MYSVEAVGAARERASEEHSGATCGERGRTMDRPTHRLTNCTDVESGVLAGAGFTVLGALCPWTADRLT